MVVDHFINNSYRVALLFFQKKTTAIAKVAKEVTATAATVTNTTRKLVLSSAENTYNYSLKPTVKTEIRRLSLLAEKSTVNKLIKMNAKY